MKTLRYAAVAAMTAVSAWAQVVTVSPTAVPVHLGTFYQFSVKVTGVTNTAVGWSIAVPSGATGSPGNISTGGRYTPPPAMPSINTVIVTVSSLAAPSASATATITLQNPVPTVASTSPSVVPAGPFTITVNGSGFVSGALVLFGGEATTTTFVSANRLTAAGVASDPGQRKLVTVVNPDPGQAQSVDAVTVLVGSDACGADVVTAGAASRFLQQAAFGPDRDSLAHVECVGLDPYITEQLAEPISPYPDAGDTGYAITQLQARFFANAVHGRDQLRQRVAFALSQIFVVSAVEESAAAQFAPWLALLQKDAFVNFRTLMQDVTLSPTMGEYLDMRNNDKANPATDTRANENYARELMQLFTIGLYQLHNDGTPQTSNNQPIPTYDQSTIQDFAKIYTGWTYATKPGATLQKHNPTYYGGPMVAFEANHDTTSKTLLNGLVVPAGGTAESDLKAALDNIFSHPNVGPFIGKQLIQHLVTSNPSPEYVARVASVFNDNGHGVRGDLAATVRAILLDSEARAGDGNVLTFNPRRLEGDAFAPFVRSPSRSSSALEDRGHLLEPVLYIPAILRGLGASVNDSNTLQSLASTLGQTLFNPPTVFNYFAPSYQIPGQYVSGQSLGGPEFQLDTPSAAVGRYNIANTIVFGSLGAGAVIDWTPFSSLGNNQMALTSLVADRFFHGNMPAAVNTELQHATGAITGTTAAAAKSRAQAAVYLAVTSSDYSVEH
jgi:uncharacterized protein (DUF1800 family)